MDAETWNARYPVGTPVEVTVVRAYGDRPAQTVRTRTRSVAWKLGHGDSCVLVEGKTGGYGLDFVRALPLAEPLVGVRASGDAGHVPSCARDHLLQGVCVPAGDEATR